MSTARLRRTTAVVLAAAGFAGWRWVAARRSQRLSSAQSGEWHETWHTVRGRRIYSRHAQPAASCTGPSADLPLLLIHGFGVSGAYFIPLATCLSKSYRVAIPDLPGHGNSEARPRALNIAGLARALLEWMEMAGITKCVLIGQSMGAQIAVEAILRQPHRFDRFVMIGPTRDPRAGLLAHVWRLLKVVPFEHPALFPIVLRDYLRMGPRLLPECRAMLNHKLEEGAGRIDLPVMLIKGGRDAIVPDRWTDQMKETMRARRTVVIPSRGHAVHFSAPAEVAAAIDEFLQERNKNEKGGS